MFSLLFRTLTCIWPPFRDLMEFIDAMQDEVHPCFHPLYFILVSFISFSCLYRFVHLFV